MTKHLDYPTCLKLKEIGIDQTLKSGDFFYIEKDKVGLYDDADESLWKEYFKKYPDTIYIKIPSESDLRDAMTVEEWDKFICFLWQKLENEKGKNYLKDIGNIAKVFVIAQHQKDNQLQLMADWLIEKRGK